MNAVEKLRLNLKARRKNRALVTVEAKDLRELLEAADLVQTIIAREWPLVDGGHRGYRGNGKWFFTATSLGMVTPEELNELFRVAGITPKVIVPKGACRDCRFSLNGEERGWEFPCGGCSRPGHDRFEAKR